MVFNMCKCHSKCFVVWGGQVSAMNWVKQTSKGPSHLYDLLRARQVEIITEQRILKSLEAKGIDVQGKAGASKGVEVSQDDNPLSRSVTSPCHDP